MGKRGGTTQEFRGLMGRLSSYILTGTILTLLTMIAGSGLWCGGPLALVYALFAGVCLARIASRAVPVRTDDLESPTRQLHGGLFDALLSLGIPMALACGGLVSPDPGKRLVGLTWMVPNLLAFAVAVVIERGRTRRVVDALNRPYCLFLRRHGGFADRDVQRALLRASSRLGALVQLEGPHLGSGYWDPVAVAFAGIFWRRPVQSMPVWLRVQGSNDEWKTAISGLIEQATVIVVDVSEESASMNFEVQAIRQLDAGGRAVVIHEESPEASVRVATDIESIAPAEVISYRRSWTAAAPRLLVLYGLCWLGVGAYDLFIGLRTEQQAGRLDTTDGISVAASIFSAVAASSLCAAMPFVLLFARPTVARRTRNSLEAAVSRRIEGALARGAS